MAATIEQIADTLLYTLQDVEKDLQTTCKLSGERMVQDQLTRVLSDVSEMLTAVKSEREKLKDGEKGE